MVSVLTSYSDDLSLNPSEVYNLPVKLMLKPNNCFQCNIQFVWVLVVKWSACFPLTPLSEFESRFSVQFFYNFLSEIK